LPYRTKGGKRRKEIVFGFKPRKTFRSQTVEANPKGSSSCFVARTRNYSYGFFSNIEPGEDGKRRKKKRAAKRGIRRK
jgi:hypothetical protein